MAGPSLFGALAGGTPQVPAPGGTAASTAGQPIGVVEKLAGQVFVTHADGTRGQLHEGDPVFQGDELQTGASGGIGIVLADKTTFSMAQNGRMVLDEMVYDPASQSGSVAMSVMQGVFTFVSGQVAKTDPDAMAIQTPVGTIGIRGTQVGVDLSPGGEMSVVLMEERDGLVGEVVIANDHGVQVLNSAYHGARIGSFMAAPSSIFSIGMGDVLDVFGNSLSLLPVDANPTANDYRDIFERVGSLGEDLLAAEHTMVEVRHDSGADLARMETAAGPNAAGAAHESPTLYQSDVSKAHETFRPVVQILPEEDGRTIERLDDSGSQIITRDSDPITATESETVVTAIHGSGRVVGTDGDDVMFGSTGTDVLVGGAGDDVVDGGAGDDILVGGNGAGFDTYIGGTGIDTVTFQSSTQGVVVDLSKIEGASTDANARPDADAAGYIDTDRIEGVENVLGSTHDDVISGNAAANVLIGSGGDDVLTGGAGDDLLVGDNLALAGFVGSEDLIHLDMTAAAGSDTATFTGNLKDYTLVVDAAAGTVTVTDTLGRDGTDTLVGIENLRFADGTFTVQQALDSLGAVIDGGAGDDVIAGGAGDDVIAGGAGDDVIEGGAGDDVIEGGAGDDTIDGGTGSDTIDGGTGGDTIYGSEQGDVLAGGDDADTIYGNAGNDSIEGGGGDDFIDGGTGADSIDGGAGSDVILGSEEGDVLKGGDDADTIYGNAGNDIIEGGGGDDTMFGGDGDDVLDGGAGSDVIDGGSGSDKAVFAGALADYVVTVDAATGEAMVAGADGTDVLSGVEYLQFSDGTFSVAEAADRTASAPTLEVAAASGAEDSAIALDIGAALTDADGSETLSSITIGNLPAGATLSAGTDNGDGTWTVTAGQLDGLKVTPPADFSGAMELSVAVTATEASTGAQATTSATITVDVAGVADRPTLAIGGEDTFTLAAQNEGGTSAAFHNAYGYYAMDENGHPVQGGIIWSDTRSHIGETAAIEGLDPASIGYFVIPNGGALNAGISDGMAVTFAQDAQGRWTVVGPDGQTLQGEYAKAFFSDPALNPDGMDHLVDNAVVGTQNWEDLIRLGDRDFNDVNVDASWQAAPVSGDEDTAIALDIAAGLTDASETLTVTIAGVPAGASLSAGTDNGDGTWTLSGGDLAGLTVTPPADSNADFALTVTATATDGADIASTEPVVLNVLVTGVADEPTVSVTNVTGAEDAAIALNVAAGFGDSIDLSETHGIVISGLPAGAVLSAGTPNADGSAWTLTPAQLTGLTVTPPSDYSGSFDLTVTATATENDGDVARAAASFTVTVTPVADAVTVAAEDAAGLEDTWIPLDISAAVGDAGETLSISIAGLPDGAILSAGTDNGDGTWTLAPGQLDGLAIKPTADSDADFALRVTATSTDGTGTSSAATTFDVTVTGVADEPTVSVTNVTGAEDAAIALNVAAGFGDSVDLSETHGIVISGLPAGAELSAGTDNLDGTWTLTPAQLTGLTVTPPSDYSGSFDLTVTATATENDGDVARAAASFTVTVTPVADAVTVAAEDAAGLEDTWIPLDISAAVGDAGETLSITIAGLPDGAILSAGTDNGDGTWTLAPGQLDGLAVKPAADSDADFALRVTATSTDGAGTSSAATTFDVTVTGVADEPTVGVTNVTGSEDTALALNISAGLGDLDGSESLSLVISGLPDGASLSAGTDNGDGTWTLTPAQLADLKLTPPENYNGEFALRVVATSTEAEGDTETAEASFTVAVTGGADAPTLIVTDTAGLEDHAIRLDIAAALTDAGETLSIVVGGVPTGASLSAGTDNGDGTWTLTAEQLDGLSITPPADSNEDFALTVTATSADGTSTASTTATVTVAVTGLADAVGLATGNETVHLDVGANDTLVGTAAGETLSGGAGNDVLRGEAGDDVLYGDGANPTPALVALDIAASFGDSLDLSETHSVTLSGLPAGATLSAGTRNADGSWTVAADQASGLTLSIPGSVTSGFQIAVTATATENDGDVATAAGTIDVAFTGAPAGNDVLSGGLGADRLYGGAGDDTLNYSTDATWSGMGAQNAGSPGAPGTGEVVSINGLGRSHDLFDGGAGTDTLVLGGGNEAVFLEDTYSPNGTAARIAGIEVIDAGAGNDVVDLTSSRFSYGDVTIDGGAGNDLLWGNAGNDSIVGGTGDDRIDGGAGADRVDAGVGNDVAVFTASQNATGGRDFYEGGAGTDTLRVMLTQAQFDSAAFRADLANYRAFLAGHSDPNSPSGQGDSFQFQSLNLDARNFEKFEIYVNGTPVDYVASAPTLTATDAAGLEDTAIPLDIAAALTDGGETLSIVVAGVPAGASLSAGTDNGDGTWTLTGAQLNGLTVTPPADSNADFTLTVTATSAEGNIDQASVTATLAVTVTGVADEPTVTVSDASGTEDRAIALDIASGLGDLDGSESLSLTIAGVPAGASLSAGTDNGDGTWTLTPAQLTGLSITPPLNYAGAFDLSVMATATENDGDTETGAASFTVTVAGGADAPTLAVRDAAGLEDSAIALDIGAALTDLDETLSIIVGGVPAGASLSAGTDNGDGTWTLTAAQLDGLKITPPADSNADFALTVTATSADGASTASTTATVNVAVTGVADEPALASAIGVGVVQEGDSSITVVNHGSDAGFNNTYGYYLLDDQGRPTSGEIIWANVKTTVGQSFTLDDVDPDRVGFFLLSDGAGENSGLTDGMDVTFAQDATGKWQVLDPSGRALRADANGGLFFTNQSLNADGVDHERDSGAAGSQNWEDIKNGGDFDYNDANFNVTSRDEAGAIQFSLDIDAALADTDGSETLSVTIAGLPEGASLSAGTDNGDGTWTLSPAQLTGLTLTVADSLRTDFDLTVTATTTENDGDTAAAVQVLTVPMGEYGEPVAPVVTAADATGREDTPIALDVDAAVSGGETVAEVVVSGLPQGASLNVGTRNGDGTWTLRPADLDSLRVVPPENYSGTFDMQVTAISSDGGRATETLAVTVEAVADRPDLAVADTSGEAGEAIPLDIAAALTDLDGSETLSVTIAGVPTGASLSAGTDNGDGSWTLSAGQLDGLTIKVPEPEKSEFQLGGSSSGSESGTIGAWFQTVDGHDITVSAFAKNGRPAEIDADAGRGIGVEGLGDSEIDAEGSGSESMIVDFDGMLVDKAEVGIRALFIEDKGNGHFGAEEGHWEAYRGDELVGSGDFEAQAGASDGRLSLDIAVDGGFDKLRFTAVGNHSDYLLESLKGETGGETAAPDAFDLTVTATAVEPNGDLATTTATLTVDLGSGTDDHCGLDVIGDVMLGNTVVIDGQQLSTDNLVFQDHGRHDDGGRVVGSGEGRYDDGGDQDRHGGGSGYSLSRGDSGHGGGGPDGNDHRNGSC
ncbi:MAG: Ig-like domain-containing protein [Magnetospirillum sp. WYHS-4]